MEIVGAPESNDSSKDASISAVDKLVEKALSQGGDTRKNLNRLVDSDEYWKHYRELSKYVSLEDPVPELPNQHLLNVVGDRNREKVLVASRVAVTRVRLTRQKVQALAAKGLGVSLGQGNFGFPSNPLRVLLKVKMHPKVRGIVLNTFVGEVAFIALMGQRNLSEKVTDELLDIWFEAEKACLGFLWSDPRTAGLSPHEDLGCEIPLLDVEQIEREHSDYLAGSERMRNDAKKSGLPIFPGIDEGD